MHQLDYLVVGIFLVALMTIGLSLSHRAGKNTNEYILAGRKLPWWLAGLSISATGLNASTMLQDSRKIRQDGIAGMWFTWGAAINLIIGAVWFSRLWRRGEFVTQMEFYHARYRGRPATFCRVYDAVIFGVISAAIWAAVGLVGMKKIAAVLLHVPATFSLLGLHWPTGTVVVLGLVVITLIYSAGSGVYGVVWTDMIEFLIALVSAYTLMFIVFREVGWSTGLREKLEALPADHVQILHFLPTVGPVLFYYLLLSPILNQGGYNPNIQRFLGVKNEREVIRTAVFTALINFGVKTWPFYICGLCGMFIVSDHQLLAHFPAAINSAGQSIPDYEMVFPLLVGTYLPAGLLGLMVTGFLSAFMSAFDTNIHNSTSIFVNDLYRAYLKPGLTERHYVRVSRCYMVLIAALASAIGIVVHDILMLTMLAFTIAAASGWIKFLRFVWWRANGAAEVAAQIVSLAATLAFVTPIASPAVLAVMRWTGQSGNDGFYVTRSLMLIGTSTLASVLAIALSKPEPMDHLCSFYRKVRPFGWWGPVREACGDTAPAMDSVPVMTLLTIACLALVFGVVFALLGLLLAFWAVAIGGAAAAIVGTFGFRWGVARLYPAK